MQREYKIGNKINDWTVTIEPFYEGEKEKIGLMCKCGKECIYDVRSVNRAKFSNNCKSCAQKERHEKEDRVYNVGDILMNLKILKIYSGKVISYQVECLTCGNIYHTGHSTLNKKKNGKGLEFCKKCFKYDKKTQKGFTMCTENLSLSYYKILERQASIRGIKFSISPEYLESIFTGTCYLSGLPITLGTRSRRNGEKNLGTASLDRIDSKKGYEEGNVKWCFKKINVMKHETNYEDFIEMCKKIAEFNK